MRERWDGARVSERLDLLVAHGVPEERLLDHLVFTVMSYDALPESVRLALESPVGQAGR